MTKKKSSSLPAELAGSLTAIKAKPTRVRHRDMAMAKVQVAEEVERPIGAAFIWTAAHIQTLEDMAAAVKTQPTIAAHFGLPLRTFEDHLANNKGDNVVRLAWERGKARAEQAHIDRFLAVVDRMDGTKMPAVTAAIFFAKAQFGWRDRPDTSSDTASRITFVLPGPMSEAEYFAKLGIAAPIDARDGQVLDGRCTEVRSLPAPSRANIEAGLTADGKLVTKLEKAPIPVAPSRKRAEIVR